MDVMKLTAMVDDQIKAIRELAKTGTDEELAEFLMGSAYGAIIGQLFATCPAEARYELLKGLRMIFPEAFEEPSTENA